MIIFAKNQMMKKFITIFLTIVVVVLFNSCNNNSNQNNNDTTTNEDTSVLKTDVSHEKRVKKIFYTIPSPIELSNLLKKAGVPYEKSIVNPLSNYDNYITIQQLAFNLGVYGTDVSYARIMDQIQTSLNYIIVIKKISDKLGIPEEDTKDIFERLEKNINNKDSVLNLIAQSYGNADSFFKNNDQGNIAAMVLLGGWIEGMYIALNIAEEAQDKDLIYRRIAEQKMSLTNLIELLKSYKSDTIIAKYIGDLEELQVVFDNINIVYKNNKIKTDTANKITIINGESTVAIKDDQLEKIKSIVSRIRNSIIK
jgi:hypothetical protein